MSRDKRKSHKESQLFSNRVAHYYQNVVNSDKKKTIQHFLEGGENRRTIYNVIYTLERENRVQHVKKSGRIPKKLTPQNENKVRKMFETTSTISVRTAAAKIGISPTPTSVLKVQNLNIIAKVVPKVPKYVEDQKVRAEEACLALSKKLDRVGKSLIVIIDDESYVPLSPGDVPGRKFIHLAKSTQVIPDEHLATKSKFFKKYLVWQFICEDGKVSVPVILQATMNAYIYLNKCVKKVLVPFIMKHYGIENVLFWPDVASCHYHRSITEYLDSIQLKFVSKVQNAPNCPQARPIELFWALCKEQYKKSKKEPKDIKEFSRLWRKLSIKVAEQSGESLMVNLRKKLKSIGTNGVYNLLK